MTNKEKFKHQMLGAVGTLGALCLVIALVGGAIWIAF